MAKIRKRPSMSASVEADAGKATEAKRPRAEVASKPAAVARSVQGGRSKPAPQLQKAMADPEVNILAKVLQKQLDSLGDAKVRGIEKNLLDFVAANGSLKMSSHCSGSNVAFLAAATVALKTTGKNCILNMYDVEKDKDKQRWLRVLGEGFGERCIFKEMGDMADTHAWCDLHGRKCCIPNGQDGPHITSRGCSCNDISKANPRHKEYEHCVASGSGVTAFTLKSFHQHVTFHAPPIAICENVQEFVSTPGSTNMAEFSKMFSKAGYACKYVLVDACQWVAQRRKRVYIILIHLAKWQLDAEGAKEVLTRITECVSKLSTHSIVKLDDILLENSHPLVRKELEHAKRVAAARGPPSGDTKWAEKHLQEMSKLGLTQSSLAATEKAAELENNPWFKTLTEREKHIILIKLASSNVETIDIGRSVDRVATSSEDSNGDVFCSTLLTQSTVWVVSRGRILAGPEACSLQCIPCSVLPKSQSLNRSCLVPLAGDAFCGASFMSVLLAIFVHLPSQFHDVAEESDAQILATLDWCEQ